MTSCPNRWLSRRHRFEPRYDTVPPTLEAFAGTKLNTSVHGMEMTFKRLTRRTYVCDVCVYCGATVDRARTTTPGEG
jgi:hypothetical protein